MLLPNLSFSFPNLFFALFLSFFFCTQFFLSLITYCLSIFFHLSNLFSVVFRKSIAITNNIVLVKLVGCTIQDGRTNVFIYGRGPDTNQRNLQTSNTVGPYTVHIYVLIQYLVHQNSCDRNSSGQCSILTCSSISSKSPLASFCLALFLLHHRNIH